jgi:hypothetical protein
MVVLVAVHFSFLTANTSSVLGCWLFLCDIKYIYEKKRTNCNI